MSVRSGVNTRAVDDKAVMYEDIATLGEHRDLQQPAGSQQAVISLLSANERSTLQKERERERERD